MNLDARALLLSGFLLFTSNLPAVLMQPMSVEELSQQADLVVHGVVTNKTCLRDTEGRIYTKVEISVGETWKGDNAAHSLTIVHGGGTIGDERVEVSGQVEYTIGKEVVAFLVRNPHGEAVTLGLAQGEFHVWQDRKTGEKFAHNLFHGAPEASVYASEKSSVAKTQKLSLAELKHSVQEARR